MNRSKIVLSIAAGLGFALSAQAQQPPSSDATERNTAGIRVAIDPATGRIRDLTPEESAALSTAAAAQPRSKADIARYGSAPADNAAAALTVRKSANGSVSVRVPRSAMTQLNARVGADGKIVVSETGHADAATRPEAIQ